MEDQGLLPDSSDHCASDRPTPGVDPANVRRKSGMEVFDVVDATIDSTSILTRQTRDLFEADSRMVD